MATKLSPTEAKLDDMFVKEVFSVMNLVGRLPSRHQIMPTCTRWFHIFKECTPKERFARNYMLLYMHKQLNDRKTLGSPFTDPHSSQMNLRTLHQVIRQRDNAGELTSSGDDELELEIPEEREDLSLGSCQNLEVENSRLIDMNAELTRELLDLQKQGTKLQSLRKQLEKSIEMQSEQVYMLDKENRYLKRIFASSSINALKQMCLKHTQTDSFFATLLSVLCEQESDRRKVQLLDELFRARLLERIDCYQKEQKAPLVQEASEQYDKLREKVSTKYKKVLAMKLDAQEQELTLSAMRYLTILRKLFLETFTGKAGTNKAVLKFLQRSYEEMSDLL